MLQLVGSDAHNTENSDTSEKNQQPFQTEMRIAVTAETLVGEVVGARYRLDSEIGGGATSTVYGAMDPQTDSPVAIKVLHKHLCTDSNLVERFLRESKTASILNHPHIAKVLGTGQTNYGQPFTVLELVEGKNLQQILMLSPCGSIPWQRAVALFAQICSALSAAHLLGIVHRDIKPTNIMVYTDKAGHERVKLLDFGIAKMLPAQGDTYFNKTQSGETLGSISYMSPEQCLDEDIDGRTDIYSLGCVMYEVITGKPAFNARTAFLTMNEHLSSTPVSFRLARPDIQVPSDLEELIFCSVAVKKADRFQTIDHVGGALAGIDGTKNSALQGASIQSSRFECSPKRPKLPKTVMVAMVLLCCFAAFFIQSMVAVIGDTKPLPYNVAKVWVVVGFAFVVLLSLYQALELYRRKSWVRIWLLTGIFSSLVTHFQSFSSTPVAILLAILGPLALAGACTPGLPTNGLTAGFSRVKSVLRNTESKIPPRFQPSDVA